MHEWAKFLREQGRLKRCTPGVEPEGHLLLASTFEVFICGVHTPIQGHGFRRTSLAARPQENSQSLI